jgi:hypothetical protein
MHHVEMPVVEERNQAMSDVKLKPCPASSFATLGALGKACQDCPNRKPSEVEQELRNSIDDGILIVGRYLKETPAGNQPNMIVLTAERWIENARMLLAKGQL